MFPSSVANTLVLTVILASLSLSPSTSKSAEHRIECPAQLEPVSLKVSSPAGWSSFVRVGLWLHSAGPMDGPPSVMAVLKEDYYSEHGNTIVTKWVWNKKGDSYPEGKWMACNYGESNEVVLSKRIDDNASECTVTYTRKKPRRDDIDIRCKW